MEELIDMLNLRYNGLSDHVFKIAVNDKVIEENIPITDLMKIDLLPPFAGG